MYMYCCEYFNLLPETLIFVLRENKAIEIIIKVTQSADISFMFLYISFLGRCMSAMTDW